MSSLSKGMYQKKGPPSNAEEGKKTGPLYLRKRLQKMSSRRVGKKGNRLHFLGGKSKCRTLQEEGACTGGRRGENIGGKKWGGIEFREKDICGKKEDLKNYVFPESRREGRRYYNRVKTGEMEAEETENGKQKATFWKGFGDGDRRGGLTGG